MLTGDSSAPSPIPTRLFRWSLYLLLALWPLAVYWGGRLFGLEPVDRRVRRGRLRRCSPLRPGIGYETKAYVWVGYGVWTQLWASWTLPLAWGFSFRALRVAAVRPAAPCCSSP